MLSFQSALIKGIPLIRKHTALFAAQSLTLSFAARLTLKRLAQPRMDVRAGGAGDAVGGGDEGLFARLRVRVGREGAVGRGGSGREGLGVEFRGGVVADFDSWSVLVG
jgi:hypothetical protein